MPAWGFAIAVVWYLCGLGKGFLVVLLRIDYDLGRYRLCCWCWDVMVDTLLLFLRSYRVKKLEDSRQVRLFGWRAKKRGQKQTDSCMPPKFYLTKLADSPICSHITDLALRGQPTLQPVMVLCTNDGHVCSLPPNLKRPNNISALPSALSLAIATTDLNQNQKSTF
jgi:hypothetical protein